VRQLRLQRSILLILPIESHCFNERWLSHKLEVGRDRWKTKMVTPTTSSKSSRDCKSARPKSVFAVGVGLTSGYRCVVIVLCLEIFDSNGFFSLTLSI